MVSIAISCGIIAIIASVFAIVVMFLTRNNIVNILEKDVVLFDKNFEIKKSAITNALTIIDEVFEYGKEATLRPDFERKAKICYNDLLCVMTDVTIADEFYNITLDKNIEINDARLANFKLLCRHDIGFKTKKAKTVKRLLAKEKNIVGENETMLRTTAAVGNTQNLSSSTNATATMPKQTVQTQPQQPIQRPVQQTQPRPAVQPQKPATQQPAVQPVKKPGRPKK